MQSRDKVFYDIVSQGLASLGFVDKNGVSGFQQYLDYYFAEKYNMDATFRQIGFEINPNLPIKPMWEQLEMTRRPYTMASYVDIDSDGPTKSTDGFTLKTGEIPTFKHEFSLNRKVLREQMQLMDSIGHATPNIIDTVMELFFTSLDDLLGGNYNTMAFQRHRIVSDQCKLVLTDKNNPLGYAETFSFKLDTTKNVHNLICYTDNAGNVTQASNIATLNPLKAIKQIIRDMQNKDHCGPVHIEIEKSTWENFYNLDYIQKMYVNLRNPLVTDATMIATLTAGTTEGAIKAWIEDMIGCRIEVIDFLGATEYFNKTTGSMDYHYHKGFKEGVMVIVPDGIIGDVQFGKPLFIDTPGARTALFDGGRTLIRTIFNDENMVQTTKSEVTGFCIPNKTRWMHYVNIATITNKVEDIQHQKKSE